MTDEKALWYVVHTYSGYENKVANDLVKTVENNGMGDLIQDVSVPIEEIVEIRNGKPHTIQHKLFPGYVLVKMIKTTETWYIVRNTRGVTGFVGPGSEPIPLTDEEFERMTSCQGTIRVDLEPGDSVRIKTGSVENAIGTVEEINACPARPPWNMIFPRWSACKRVPENHEADNPREYSRLLKMPAHAQAAARPAAWPGVGGTNCSA